MQNRNTRGNITASQDFVPIKEVKDGIVILDDGTLVSIALVTSVNISLKSYEEQELVIASFRDFLNLLEFPVQIVVQSRRMDIKPYLDTLEKRLQAQEYEILKLQTIEYIAFIKSFTEAVSIMDKHFFLVVSYKPMIFDLSERKDIISSLFGGSKNKDETIKANTEAFEEARAQLEQRMGLLGSSLSRTGVKIKRLDTESVLEVFYSIFNPGQGDLSGFINNSKQNKK